jgi:hypothetical protein
MFFIDCYLHGCMTLALMQIGYWQAIGPEQECGLHPLIHTLLEFTLAQDVVFCQ